MAHYYQSGWFSVAVGAFAFVGALDYSAAGRVESILAAFALLALALLIYPRLYRLVPDARKPALLTLNLNRAPGAELAERKLAEAGHARHWRGALLLTCFYAPWTLLLVPGAAVCGLTALIEISLALLLLRPYLGLLWPLLAGAPAAALWALPGAGPCPATPGIPLGLA
ncbi:MAG: hypothetical protein ACRD1M_11740, partial [Terriglobales bacterium]